jgi:hypothetical protein
MASSKLNDASNEDFLYVIFLLISGIKYPANS